MEITPFINRLSITKLKTRMKVRISLPCGFQILMAVLLLTANGINAQNKCDGFRKTKHRNYVIAHRGVHNGIPENSLPAYQKAIDLGCDFVEIDVRTTKDNKFVSVHNSSVDGYIEEAKGLVRNMSLAELKALDIGARFGEEFKNTRIPEFEEILQLCQGKIGIYLDLKDAPVPELMEIIRKYNMEQDIIWYIPASYLMELKEVEKLFGKSFPMPDPGSEKNLENALLNLKPCAIATDMGELSQSFVAMAHKYGAKIFVDEKEGTKSEWEKIIGWGTDGIQTDKPSELIQYLNQNKR
jgi:glycerophosphoryl diester phosphodiesterase